MARAVGTRGRFFAAYLVLGALVGTGIGLFIVLLERPGPPPPPPWSTWRPASSTTATQAQEIARHVGSAYRLSNGGPLARIAIGPLGQSRQDFLPIGIPTKVQPKTLQDFQFLARDESIVYTLCGTGRNCRINGGTGSLAEATALRREALELALYTLKYSRPIGYVFVLFPPGPRGSKPTSGLLFHRDQLSSQLRQPLHRTLPRSRPPVPGGISPGEERTVDRLTGNVYRFVGVENSPAIGEWLLIWPSG